MGAAIQTLPVHPFADPVVGELPLVPTECPICKCVFPSTHDYWVFDNGKPKGPCLGCIKSFPARQALEEKTNALQRAMQQFVAASRANTLKTPAIAELYGGVIAELGGVEEVCRLWAYHINVAATTKPGSKTVLDQFYGLFKMGVSVGTHNMKDVESLTDDELVSEVTEIFAKTLSVESQESASDADESVGTETTP